MSLETNVIYIHSHDTGRIIEPYGYPVSTPNLNSFAAVRGSLRERLDHWMESTSDPLLVGPLEAPPGAELNRPGGLSPNEDRQTVS